MRLVPLSLFVGVLLAAACGGSDNAASPTVPAPTASPETAVAPSPTAAAQATVVPSPAAPAEPDGDIAYEHVLALSVDIGSRPAGSEGEVAAAEYISQQLESFGYETEIQEVPFESEAGREASLRTTAPDETAIDAGAFARSAAGQAEGELVYAETGLPEDYPPEGIAGDVALVRRGTIFFDDKVANAEAAGASAVIVFNNEPGNFSGALTQMSTIPAASVSQDDGERLLSLLEEGPVSASLDVSEATQRTSRNVIARPSDEPCETISGGHFDSVPAGPGANDNASGTAAVLELARVVATRDLPGVNCFVLFGAEEPGLLGSRYFVGELTPEEVDALQVMLNFDVVSDGDFWQLVGTPDLTAEAAALAADAGIQAMPGELQPGLASDHVSFLEVDVPVVFFFREGQYFLRTVIHTADDTADIVVPSDIEDAVTMGLLLLTNLDEGSDQAADGP